MPLIAQMRILIGSPQNVHHSCWSSFLRVPLSLSNSHPFELSLQIHTMSTQPQLVSKSMLTIQHAPLMISPAQVTITLCDHCGLAQHKVNHCSNCHNAYYYVHFNSFSSY
jgi:hypothetical protein